MSQLPLVIRALGVEKVVWIDDMFAAVSHTVAPDLVDLATKISERKLFAEIGHPEIDDEEEKVGLLVTILESNTEIVTKAIQLLGGGGMLNQARKMMSLMGCDAEERSGSAWQGILSGDLPLYKNTLFLVDRDFRTEGLDSGQSDQLLTKTVSAFLVDDSSNYCVVVTKEVGADEEVKSRSTLLEHLLGGNPPKNDALIPFSVISKNALAAGAEESLSKSLRNKLGGVVLYSMLQQVEQSLEKSVVALRDMLASDFPNINKAVLHNSYKEGASELDVLLRILQQKLRLELADSFQPKSDDVLRKILARFRLFQLDAEAEDEINKHTISGELIDLCRAEVLTDGALVNQMMLPIVPGDVFASISSGVCKVGEMKSWPGDLKEGTEYLMLLGQLCDIVPRGDTGESASNMAFLARFSVKAAKGHDAKMHRSQIHSGRVGWMMVGDLALHFDFRDVLAANVAALQLCTFNRYGAAYLSEADTIDDAWSLTSVARAKRNALELFAKTTIIPSELNFYALGFNNDDAMRSLKVQKRQGKRIFSYPVRRVCRIRDLEASEALGALERYWRRPAKPHYFVN